MKQTMLVILLLTGAAFAQSDNLYCNDNGTWKGTTATNPVLKDGPSELPTVCYNTDPKNTPSPGPVITVNAGDSLQTAYNNAQCGSTLLLAHGAKWDDPFSFPAKNCDDQHYITIRSDGQIPPPGTRVSPAYVPEMAQLNMRAVSGIQQVGDHLRFIGIYFSKGKPGIFFMLPALLKNADHVIFDRIYVHCNPGEECQHGLVVNTGKYVALIDSYMDEFHCIAVSGACVDSQAFSGGTSNDPGVKDSGPVKIVNNFLEASTENILFGGGAADGAGPNNMEIRRNWLYKDPKWNPADPNFTGTVKYIVKNNFELKNGTHVLVEGNIFENNWGGYTQRGHAILFTPKNQNSQNGSICPLCAVNNVTFRYNIILNAAGMMTVGSGSNDVGAYCLGQHYLSVHDNVARGLQYPTCYACNSILIQLGSGYDANNPPPDESVLSDVTIRNNTIIADNDLKPGVSGLFAIGGTPPGVATVQVANIAFTNNVATTLSIGAFATGGQTNNCATGFFAKPNNTGTIWKSCFIGDSPFTGNVLVNYPKKMSDYPDGNMFAPNLEAVGFDDLAGGVLSTQQDNAYAGKSANMDLVNLATNGVNRTITPEEARKGAQDDHRAPGKQNH